MTPAHILASIWTAVGVACVIVGVALVGQPLLWIAVGLVGVITGLFAINVDDDPAPEPDPEDDDTA